MRMSASHSFAHVDRVLDSRFVLVLAALLGGCASSSASPAPVDVGPCRDGDPDRERWGTSCLCCHTTEFGVAGSLAGDAGISTITITDSEGRTSEMSPDFF